MLLDVAIGTPPGNGFNGLYQSCWILAVGLVTVPEKVTGAPELQVMAGEVGATELVGWVVFMPIATVCWNKQPVARSTPVTVSMFAAEMPTVLVLAVNEGLVQL